MGGLLIRTASSSGAAGSTRYTFPVGLILLPGQYYIVTSSSPDYSGVVTESPPANLSSAGISDSAGIAITLADGTTVIDSVGMSSGTIYKEGNPLTPLSAVSNQSYERNVGGALDSCQDTGDNFSDFELITGDPQNSSTPRRLCGYTFTADLSLTQTISNTASNTGVIITITLSNNGPDDASAIEVKDLLPAGLTYDAPYSASTGTYANNTGIWMVGILANGSSATLKIAAKITSGGVIINSAEITKSDQLDSNATNDISSVSIPTTPIDSADLNITKTVNNSAPNVNDNVVFTILVKNEGTDSATNVHVKDWLPEGLTYVSDNGGGAYIISLGIWQVGTLADGASKTLKITASVTTNGSKINKAEIFSLDQSDPDPTDDSASSTVTPIGGIADLNLTQSYAKASPAVAGQVVITITISNVGPYNATNVVAKDKLPSGLTYVSDNSAGSYNKDTGLWSAGAIPKNSNSALKITAKVDSSGTMLNQAEVWSVDQSDIDSTPGNSSTTEDDDDDKTIESADLSITKNMDNVTPIFGTDVVFTIRVSNAGPDNATGVEVKDLLPANYSYLSDDSGGAYNSSTGIWTVGTVNNGSTRTLKITATLIISSIAVNRAEVWKSDQIDIDSIPGNSSTSTDDDASAPFADLRITQTVDNAAPSINSNVVFTIVVANDGTVGTTGIQVKDLLPVGLTFVSDDGSGAYVSSTGIWTVGTLANGASSTLKITAKMTTSGTHVNWAEVWKSDLPDPDSTPANSSTTEDDDASATVSFSVTPAPTKVPLTPTPTPVQYTFDPRPIINEILPRPGFDWNQDGRVDVFDEFIEIKNLTAIDINLKGWKLDDEANKGSSPFTLPDVTLKPGQRRVFYGSQTNILLSDGGDSVRLINPNGKIYDAYTYSIAKKADQSICRLPDGNVHSAWYEDCTPTPNLTNTREGMVPSMPGVHYESPVCELPDTLPADFFFAECHGYGENIWNPFFWDQSGWQGPKFIPENMSKWESFIE